MPTISQLVRAGRKKIVSKTKSPALQNSPQKRGGIDTAKLALPAAHATASPVPAGSAGAPTRPAPAGTTPRS